MGTRGARLRTLLFVPGDRPDRIAKAYASGADGVAVDLEDAVASSAKAKARELTAASVREHGERRCIATVRINALDTGLAQDDLDALAPALPELDAVLLPKASPDHVRDLGERLGSLEEAAGVEPGRLAILPIIETAAGVLSAAAVAAAANERVHTLLFGPADLADELGLTLTVEGTELLHARSQVVLAAAAAGRAGPLDGPHFALDDSDGLSRSAALARRLGFAGKTVLHPRQLEAVHAAFAPTASDLAWAREVDQAFREAEAAGMSSIRIADGSFVDYPIARRARALLAEAGAQESGDRGAHG
ncbi:MAG: CoA ester lyase [Streptosporangiales bacterium]|nr:CoA ester lyase [Streptosporangiales bacterium]